MPAYPIALQPLTRVSFSRFGDVIETQGADHFPINNGTIERFHDLAEINVGTDETATPLFSIAQCNQASQLPLRIRMVERHPLASQIFYPLFTGPMIVVVAPAVEQVPATSLQAFYSNGMQGINYYRGVWHLPLIALAENQKFIIVDRGGEGSNCEEYYFNPDDEILLQDGYE